MDRRRFLALATGVVAVAVAGCSGNGEGGGGPARTDDPFPEDVGTGERGSAETTVSKTVETDRGYSDGSIECAREAHDAVRAHLLEELDDSSDVSTGYGRGPEEYDGMAVTVSLTTATYGRDGELIEEADVTFTEVVSATPPTASVRTADGDRVCSVPVYVTRREIHVD